MTDGIGYAVHPGQEHVTLKIEGKDFGTEHVSAWLAKWAKTVAPLTFMVVASLKGNPTAEDLHNHIKRKVIMLNLEPMPSSPNGWFLSSLGEQDRGKSFPASSTTYQRDMDTSLYINAAFKDATGNQIHGCMFAEKTSANTISEIKRLYNAVRHIRLTPDEAMELLEKQTKPDVVQYGRIVKVQLDSGEIVEMPYSRMI